jgi:3-oxoadipate enol-lactonase
MPSAAINGTELYYEIHGDGPTIAFAHGTGGNHMSWWRQVPFFNAQGYRCLTFDHRGYGRSGPPADGDRQTAFVADLAALLDHLGVEQCSLVAQSMGGLTCFGVARSYPHRVRALVMADTILGIQSRAIFDLRQRLIREGRASTGHAYHPGLWQRDPSLAFLYEQIRGLNPPQESNEERRRRALAETAPEDADLSEFKIPTLFLFGSEDGQMPAELGRLAHGLLPGSDYAEVEGAGHSTYFERPDEFNRIVAEFLVKVGVSPHAVAHR